MEKKCVNMKTVRGVPFSFWYVYKKRHPFQVIRTYREHFAEAQGRNKSYCDSTGNNWCCLEEKKSPRRRNGRALSALRTVLNHIYVWVHASYSATPHFSHIAATPGNLFFKQATLITFVSDCFVLMVERPVLIVSWVLE